MNLHNMCFRATINNISVISWQSVLLVEKTEENYQQNVSHKVVSSAICYKGKNMCQVRRAQRKWKRKSQLKRRQNIVMYIWCLLIIWHIPFMVL
jgi:hypothetical protein